MEPDSVWEGEYSARAYCAGWEDGCGEGVSWMVSWMFIGVLEFGIPSFSVYIVWNSLDSEEIS